MSVKKLQITILRMLVCLFILPALVFGAIYEGLKHSLEKLETNEISRVKK